MPTVIKNENIDNENSSSIASQKLNAEKCKLEYLLIDVMENLEKHTEMIQSLGVNYLIQSLPDITRLSNEYTKISRSIEQIENRIDNKKRKREM